MVCKTPAESIEKYTVVKCEVNHSNMLIKFDETGELFQSEREITSTFEFAKDQLVVADCTGQIFVTNNREVIHSFKGPEVYSHG